MENTDWIADLAFLTDLTGHLNYLNLKLQGKNRLICHLFEAVCAFEMKVNLFATQLKKGNLTHFPTCQEALTHKDYNWSRHSCVLEDMKQAYTLRFGQFRNEQAALRLLAYPFSVDTETVPGEIQLEIIELQCSAAMRSKHREMTLREFYQAMDREQFPLCKCTKADLHVWKHLQM